MLYRALFPTAFWMCPVAPSLASHLFCACDISFFTRSKYIAGTRFVYALFYPSSATLRRLAGLFVIIVFAIRNSLMILPSLAWYLPVLKLSLQMNEDALYFIW